MPLTESTCPVKNWPKFRTLIVLVMGVMAALYALGFRSDIDAQSVTAQYTTTQSHMLMLNGANVHYFDIGEGPVVLMVHGSGTEIGAWLAPANALAKKGYRVLAYDMPGSGLSDPEPSGEYTIPATVQTLHNFMAALHLEAVTVVGHSTGGQTAWTASLEMPRQIARLVLVAPTGHPHPSPLTWQLAKIPVVGEVMRFITPKFVIRDNLRQTFYDKNKISEQLVDRYSTMIRKEGTRTALLEKMRSVSFAGHENVRCIAYPTLIVWGQQDTWLPVELGRWFADQIKQAELLVLPNIGHDVPEEIAPETFASHLDAWLSKTPTAQSPSPRIAPDCLQQHVGDNSTHTLVGLAG